MLIVINIAHVNFAYMYNFLISRRLTAISPTDRSEANMHISIKIQILVNGLLLI